MEWLKNFDRTWDTKAEGRDQTDALEFARRSGDGRTIPRLMESAPSDDGAFTLEVKLAEVAGKVSRFSIPKRRSYGWCIQLVLVGGKRCRAQYGAKEDALQAYLTLHELSVSILMR